MEETMKLLTERRKRVIARLEAQLKSGKKPITDKLKKTLIETHGVGAHNDFRDDLTEGDIKRIQREIAILKERVK